MKFRRMVANGTGTNRLDFGAFDQRARIHMHAYNLNQASQRLDIACAAAANHYCIPLGINDNIIYLYVRVRVQNVLANVVKISGQIIMEFGLKVDDRTGTIKYFCVCDSHERMRMRIF